MNLAKNHKKRLLIYLDEGVSANSASFLFQFFQSFNSLIVKYTNAIELNSEKLDPSHDLICVPGGRDSPYHEKLKGEGSKRIREFVQKGGIYIGVCAGAYFACHRFEFEKGMPLEIVAERELKFYSKTAIGPILGLGRFDYTSDKGVEYPLIRFEKENFSCPIYYNGGLGFVEYCEYSEIIARYPNGIPAIIKTQYGLGKSILSGVHFEMIQNQEDHLLIKEILKNLIEII